MNIFLRLLALVFFSSGLALADTPPPGTVKLKGGSDGTVIGNVADALKVTGTSSISGPVTVVQPTGTNLHSVVDNFPASFGVTQVTSPWVISGNVGRTWSLLNTTDSVNVGNFPATFGVTQSTSPWVTSRNWNLTFAGDKVDATGSAVSVTNFPATQPVSGTVTANQGTSPWVTSVSNFPATQAVTQSGTWTVQQGTPPWTVSGTVTANIGTTGGLALDSTTTSGAQKTQITDSAGVANTMKTLGTQVVSGDYGIVTNSVIHGLTTGGGGGYVDVKVSPSGAVQVGGTLDSITSLPLPANAAQETGGHLASIDTKLTAPLTTNATLQAGSAIVGKVGIDQTTPGTTNGVQVNAALPTGTNSIGQVTANAGTNLNTSALNLETTQTAFKSANHTDLTAINTTLGTPMQNSGGSVTANAGTNLNTSALALSATQTNGTQKTQVVDGSGNVMPSGDVAARASFHKLTDGTNTTAVKAASTAAAAADPSAVVALSPNSPVPAGTNSIGGVTKVGTGSAQIIRNDYSSTNVTTAAYVQLVASTANTINTLWISDTSGQDFVLATGGAGSEVDQIQIPPGGWDSPVTLNIPSGTRISIKSKSASATAGILNITGLK